MGSSIGNILDPGKALKDPFNPMGHLRNSMQAFGLSDAPSGISQSAWNSMGSVEQESGIKPPDFESIRNSDGTLKAGMKYDPYAGEAQQALKAQAFAQGDSPWARMQLQKLNTEQGFARDLAAKQALQSTAAGQAELARFGGLGGGARERLAAGGAKNLLMANQDINRQGLMGRMGIGEQDIAMKNDLLGKFATGEAQAQQGNIGLLTGDIANKQAFDINRYNEQMRAWAANKSANAQAAAANSGGGGKK